MNNSPHENDLLRYENVTLGYGKRAILRDLNFAITRGDYLAIVGANGSGKTTLLKSILGLLTPQQGRIERDAPLHFGYVPQLQNVDEIFPLRVSEVVMMGLYRRISIIRRPNAEHHQHVQDALEEVGIAALGERLYRELSGGQKQRALVARALIGAPDVLVLDEHTNDLDIAGERAIMKMLDELHAARHFAVVMVSHSLNTVANHAREIGLLRDGRCAFAPANSVMQSEFLSEFYGLPLDVLEVGGRRVVA